LLDLNFTIHSRQVNADDGQMFEMFYWFQLSNQGLPKNYNGSVYQYVNQSLDAWDSSLINDTVFEIVVKQFLNTKNYQHLQKLVSTNLHKWSNKDAWKNIMKRGVPEGYLKYLENCYKTAYVSWSDEIGESVSILKRLVYQRNANVLTNKKGSSLDMKNAVESVTTGKEILAKSHKTWRVFGTLFPGDQVFKKISTLVESGIAKQWYEFERRVKSYSDTLVVARFKAEPKKLALNDNIVVVFYVHSTLLVVSTFAYFIEIVSLAYHFKIITCLAKYIPNHNVY